MSFSRADSNGAAISVTLPVAYVPIGASLAQGSSTANAISFGVDGGMDSDIIITNADVTSAAFADADGVSVSVTPLLGVALGDFDTDATANAFGISGGAGYDEILSYDVVTADADALATGVNVAVALLGNGVIGDLSTNATAHAVGLFGDGGNDLVINDDSIFSNAFADASATSVDVRLGIGVSVDDGTTTATSRATGVGGGAGSDKVAAIGNVTAFSKAETTDVSVSVAGLGATFSDTNVTADAASIGVDGGLGADTIDISV